MTSMGAPDRLSSTSAIRHGARPPSSGRPAKAPVAATVRITPPMAMAAPPPTTMPIMKVPVARPRRRGAKRSPIIDTAAGARAASPIPTTKRPANIIQNESDRPHSSVPRLQMTTPLRITVRRATRSASRPKGRPATE